jgi:hypothetical protein
MRFPSLSSRSIERTRGAAAAVEDAPKTGGWTIPSFFVDVFSFEFELKKKQ